ncbi:MAG: hypothetical protein HOE69_05935 [Euryarchaeota archaeon]|jgi:UPF0271 protein|nr:hypothetical protein [Euryarchaeota archaeon]
MRVLDTAALLHYPLAQLTGYVVPSQREELSRLSQDRELLLDGAKLVWRSPLSESIDGAVLVATKSGDLAGLSPVDLELLALAIELQATLVTDDYRLQNCCEVAKLQFETVVNDGISERWVWELVCTGCGSINQNQSISSKKGEHGNCEDCGSPYRVRKKR